MPFPDLLAVVVQRDVAALREPLSLVRELGADLMLARREGLLGIGHEDVDAEQTVGKPCRTLVHEEAPAAA